MLYVIKLKTKYKSIETDRPALINEIPDDLKQSFLLCWNEVFSLEAIIDEENKRALIRTLGDNEKAYNELRDYIRKTFYDTICYLEDGSDEIVILTSSVEERKLEITLEFSNNSVSYNYKQTISTTA